MERNLWLKSDEKESAEINEKINEQNCQNCLMLDA